MSHGLRWQSQFVRDYSNHRNVSSQHDGCESSVYLQHIPKGTSKTKPFQQNPSQSITEPLVLIFNSSLSVVLAWACKDVLRFT